MPHSGIGWLRKTCSADLRKVPTQSPIARQCGQSHHSPSLNRCEACGKTESSHQGAGHPYKRNNSIPEWHGWHAARRGLGRNLYRLGVPEMVIQRILRHANVSTTATSYIKTAADDGRKGMTTLGNRLAEPDVTQQDTIGTPSGDQDVEPSTVQ
jgi:integrase